MNLPSTRRPSITPHMFPSNHDDSHSHPSLGSPSALASNATSFDWAQFQPRAEDILNDEDLLGIFQAVKHLLKKNPSTDRLAKMFFSICYALGDQVSFYRPSSEDRIYFRDPTSGSGFSSVRLAAASSPSSSSPSPNSYTGATVIQTPGSNGPVNHLGSQSGTGNSRSGPRIAPKHSSPEFTRQSLSVSNLMTTYPVSENRTSPPSKPSSSRTSSPPLSSSSAAAAAPQSTLPPPTPSSSAASNAGTPNFINFPLSEYSSRRSPPSQSHSHSPSSPYPHGKPTLPHLAYPAIIRSHEPYYRPSARYPTVTNMIHSPDDDDADSSRARHAVKREAEEESVREQLAGGGGGRKRKRKSNDVVGSPGIGGEGGKKNKTPHRHGEFEQRRDDILQRLQIITMQELTHKAARLPPEFTLTIDPPTAPLNSPKDRLTQSLTVLSRLSNMKPHLDNGMNQNGIYYNSDYYRLYLAFEQFAREFARANPESTGTAESPTTPTSPIDTQSKGPTQPVPSDREKERNVHMRSYRALIEPLLTGTNWAAFRRNIVVGERMVQLTEVAGKGVLLMTKELSGSKLHLTFTNNEWEAFVEGLRGGMFGKIGGDGPGAAETKIVDVAALKEKFKSEKWFDDEGRVRKEVVVAAGGESRFEEVERREGKEVENGNSDTSGDVEEDEEDEAEELDEDEEDEERDIDMTERGHEREEVFTPNSVDASVKDVSNTIVHGAQRPGFQAVSARRHSASWTSERGEGR